MSHRFKKIVLPIVLLTMLGQNVAYAFDICAPIQPAEVVSSSDCHDGHDATEALPTSGGEVDCEHGCDVACSGISASIFDLQALAGPNSIRLIALAPNPLIPLPATLLFRPPISG